MQWAIFYTRSLWTVLCTGLAMSAITVSLVAYRSRDANRHSSLLAQYARPLNSDHISLEIRLLDVDLTAGMTSLLIHKVNPHGKYALAKDAVFLRQRIDLFVNGASYSFDAGRPTQEYEILLGHESGNVNTYPLDKHRLSLSFYMAAHGQMNGTATSLASGKWMMQSPFVPLAWTIRSSTRTMALKGRMHKSLAPSGVGEVDILIAHSNVTMWFAALVFCFQWLESIMVLLVCVHVIYQRNDVPLYALHAFAGMLFALPSLRNSQPSVPAVGTMADAIGFYWNVTLVTISFVSLAIYHIYKTYVDAQMEKNRDANKLVDALLMERRQGKMSDYSIISTAPVSPKPRHYESQFLYEPPLPIISETFHDTSNLEGGTLGREVNLECDTQEREINLEGGTLGRECHLDVFDSAQNTPTIQYPSPVHYAHTTTHHQLKSNETTLPPPDENQYPLQQHYQETIISTLPPPIITTNQIDKQLSSELDSYIQEKTLVTNLSQSDRQESAVSLFSVEVEEVPQQMTSDPVATLIDPLPDSHADTV